MIEEKMVFFTDFYVVSFKIFFAYSQICFYIYYLAASSISDLDQNNSENDDSHVKNKHGQNDWTF